MNTRDKNATYKLFAKALEQKGYTTEVQEEHPMVVTYTSPHGMVWKTKAAHMTYPFNTNRVYDIALQKSASYRLAAEAGLSIPYTVSGADAVTDEKLQALLDRCETLVVKPADLFQSKGVTVNIGTLSKLKEVILYAQSFSSSILLQQQVGGEEVRFTVLNGKVKTVLLRRTARIVGDGNLSIAELIKKENEARSLLHFEYIDYPQLDDSLVDPATLHSDRIPAKDEVIELNRSTMIRNGCSIYNISAEVDESYIKLVEKLVMKLDAGFVVVDLFCLSYKDPATTNNYWFNELNTAPSVRLYYGSRDGRQFDIVGQLADMIDGWIHHSTR